VPVPLTDLLTGPGGTGETQRRTGDGNRTGALVSETGGHARDVGDVRRMSHNPEVAGSNPAPATRKCRSWVRLPGRRSGLDLCVGRSLVGQQRTRNALSRGRRMRTKVVTCAAASGPSVTTYLPALQPARQVRRRYIEAL
jgi:hypothetical protein